MKKKSPKSQKRLLSHICRKSITYHLSAAVCLKEGSRPPNWNWSELWNAYAYYAYAVYPPYKVYATQSAVGLHPAASCKHAIMVLKCVFVGPFSSKVIVRTHTHTHTTDCCTWITTVVSIRSSTTQFSRPAGCRTFITVFFVVVESVNKSLKAASLFHTPRVCCPGCRRLCSSTHAVTPPALPSAKQHFGWHDFASIPYITTTWSWWLKTRHRRSGRTPRIPRTVYRYFWAYPFFLLFSFPLSTFFVSGSVR